MAHIVSCMLDSDPDIPASLKNYIAKPASPHPPYEQSTDQASHSSEKPFVWRMHQPERKYQLFPKDKQAALSSGKGLDPEQAFALAMGQNGEKTDKQSVSGGLRIRIKEHNLIRRRKVSVPELGPMTTVQEVAMDSPTIPGRPPLHERSISAPGHSWKPHHLADYVSVPTPTKEEKMELRGNNSSSESLSSNAAAPAAMRQPLSPRSLAPLVIPSHTSSTAPRLTRQLSLNRLRSGSTPVEPTIRSARTDDSPRTRTPFTPSSASTLATPKSAMTSSTLPTPVSAPIEARSSPKPWGESSNYALVSTPKETSPDIHATPRAETEPRSAPHPTLGHRRGQSESGSIMERGRPRKRNETRDVIGGGIGIGGLKRSVSKRSKSAERRAFETLPKGWKASEASNMLSPTEVTAIQRQALQQAARFEILRKDDVDNLSRELRNLDERTEYLRRTYTSLRAGRRNLHSRICQYLRSPRVAKFSHDSMLKQEEALAELDASIDDWVTKLEQAENRRTRVRQKLLEHVAAAATLPPQAGVVGVSETLQLAMGIKPATLPVSSGNLSTPPRSPTKTSFVNHLASFSSSSGGSQSPQRACAWVPSTILEQPLVEEAATIGLGLNHPGSAANAANRRVDVESIRIYAGDDVYALLADVENEITKMSGGEPLLPKDEAAHMSEDELKLLHRAHSQELLNGSASASASKEVSPPGSPTQSSSAATVSPVTSEVYLPSTVFRPERSALVL